MKKCNLAVVSVALAAATATMPVAAQSGSFQPGFYIGAGLGQSHVSGDQSGTVNGVRYTTTGLDDNKTTFQVNGGYQFTEMWGLELQYTDLGSRNGTVTAGGITRGTPDINAYQWGIAGTGTFMLTPKWFARGKLGISSNHISDETVTVGGTSFQVGGSNKSDVLVGIGIGYKWSENLATRLEYEYFGKFDTKNGTSSNGSASNIGLRMRYKF